MVQPLGSIGGVLHDHEEAFICLFSCPSGIHDSNTTKLCVVLKVLETSTQDHSLCVNAKHIFIEVNILSWMDASNSSPLSLRSLEEILSKTPLKTSKELDLVSFLIDSVASLITLPSKIFVTSCDMVIYHIES